MLAAVICAMIVTMLRTAVSVIMRVFMAGLFILMFLPFILIMAMPMRRRRWRRRRRTVMMGMRMFVTFLVRVKMEVLVKFFVIMRRAVFARLYIVVMIMFFIMLVMKFRQSFMFVRMIAVMV